MALDSSKRRQRLPKNLTFDVAVAVFMCIRTLKGTLTEQSRSAVLPQKLT
jgi:hypothetical protein